MKLALGLGGCHGDASQLPTPHRPSSSSRQAFWARKERSGVALCFSFFAGRGFSWERFDAYLIQVFALGRGQRLAKKKKKSRRFFVCLVLANYSKQLSEKKEKKKRNQDNIHVIYILSPLARSAEECIFISSSDPSFNVIFLLLSKSYHLLISPSKNISPSHSRLWIDSSSILSTFTSARALPPGA